MEKAKEVNKFLEQKMSVANFLEEVPDRSLVNEAREKIILRKTLTEERNDYLSILASFLNIKIKLYHAVFASLVIGLLIFYFTKNEKIQNTESPNSQYVSNIAAVRSSTVLSSIRTFAIKN